MLSRFSPYSRPTGPFVLNQDSVQAQGLVAWYPMAPSVLNAYLGFPQTPFTTTRNGGVVPAAASIGGLCANVLSSGSNDGMSRASQGTFPAPPFSIASWHYPRTFAVGDNLIWRNVGSSFIGWYYRTTNAVPQFGAYDGVTGTVAAATASESTFKWHHVVGTTTTTTARACYLNGANKGTDTTSVNPVPTGPVEAIGSNAGIDTWDGLIADIRIYNRALSDAEVWALYDPRSRWDLYWQPNTRAYSFMSAAAAAGFLLVKN